MIKRICHFDSNLEDSIFLFGARQTGKSGSGAEVRG